jgi:Putative peptidoglycan binding domain
MLARADLDFTLRAERATAPRRRAQNGASLALAWVMRPALLRPVALGSFLAFVAIVSVNALMLQKSRHPAPLLGLANGAVPVHLAPTPKPVKVETLTDPPAATSSPASVTGTGMVSVPPPPVPVPVIGQNPPLPEAVSGPTAAVVPPPRPRSPVAAGDPIARLLGADPIGSGLEPNKTILMAQRALQKVGYVVRPDGVMGATTRHALAQFERDRGLPVKRELSMRVRHELSTLSGLPVE